jgi:integrase
MKVYLLKRKAKLSKQSEEAGRVKKTSIYLMYHFGPSRKREYEFLNLYLFEKPKNQLEKDHNKQTLQLAETIRAKRVLDAQTSAHGFVSSVKSKICFIAFFKNLVDKKYDSIGSHGNWFSTYQHLVEFTGGKELPLEKVDERFLEAFKEYLLSCKIRRGKRIERLNRNSAVSYFNKVRAALREAYINKMIKDNPASRVKCIKGQDVHREFLTIEELKKLASVPCEDPVFGKAFLFGAITGLRFSDIKALRWGNIKYSEQDGYYIQYTQKKTKKAEVLPIAKHSLSMLGERGSDEEMIFKNLHYSAYKNKILRTWIKSAGINKKISFHCSRHTQAVLQLSLGTDIYTVSKLLGHQNIKTTMHYLHIIDKHKIEAANKIPQLIAL